ncbi:L-threonylcarbamoyladenylate synthase [Aureimonas jatrophae]|uniref:L-threonylcarbamoyladenylate synthase n=1 Tax=Aureimonas jatrophae TaxID=1166073 RepID=UPI000B85669A|nr:L-threonylcarbamoyladenylate synthase [Aureimonas jatrophae]MBB3949644.1 L-threonylcarbamoyladenylate synthase [Aureimonas jatrophae]
MTQTTRRLPLDEPGALDEAVRILRGGGLVAAHTETVYGLCGDATNGEAVAGIFEAKGRPSFNPLICHVASLEMAGRIAVLSPEALILAERFWPGPLTLVLPMRPEASLHPLVTAGLPTVAVRVPRGPLRELADRMDRPIAAPSANRSGRISPTTAEHVLRTLDSRIALVLDGGATSHGLESAIVGFGPEGPVLLRPGPIEVEKLSAVLGCEIRGRVSNAVLNAPGQMTSHYAPHGAVRLDAERPQSDECWIGFGPDPVEAAACASATNLSPRGDLREAAANLFAALNRFDDPDIPRIAVASIPHVGLGHAINDRLRRAAADR